MPHCARCGARAEHNPGESGTLGSEFFRCPSCGYEWCDDDFKQSSGGPRADVRGEFTGL
jgi:transposase-like protein